MYYKVEILGDRFEFISEPFFNEDRMLAHDFLLMVGGALVQNDKIMNDKYELGITHLLSDSHSIELFDFMIKILKKARRIREKELKERKVK